MTIEMRRRHSSAVKAEQGGAPLRERERQWAEAGRALAAANGVSIG